MTGMMMIFGLFLLSLGITTASVIPIVVPNKPEYAFGYGVQDLTTGDIKSQEEVRSGDVVQGQYSLIDPDGTKRTVDYAADDINGFNAVVRKEPLPIIVAPVVTKTVATVGPTPVVAVAPAPAPVVAVAPAPAPVVAVAPAPAPAPVVAVAPAPVVAVAPAPAPVVAVAPAPAVAVASQAVIAASPAVSVAPGPAIEVSSSSVVVDHLPSVSAIINPQVALAAPALPSVHTGSVSINSHAIVPNHGPIGIAAPSVPLSTALKSPATVTIDGPLHNSHAGSFDISPQPINIQNQVVDVIHAPVVAQNVAVGVKHISSAPPLPIVVPEPAVVELNSVKFVNPGIVSITPSSIVGVKTDGIINVTPAPFVASEAIHVTPAPIIGIKANKYNAASW